MTFLCSCFRNFLSFCAGQFVDYLPHHNKALEKAHQSGKKTADISIDGNSYTVWLGLRKPSQVNKKTNEPQEVQRVTGATLSEQRTFSPLSLGVLQSEMKLDVSALSPGSINSFEKKLRKILADTMDKDKVSVDVNYCLFVIFMRPLCLTCP